MVIDYLVFMGQELEQLIIILAMVEGSIPLLALYGELITGFDELDMIEHAIKIEEECFDGISDEFGDVTTAAMNAYIALFQAGCTSQRVQVLSMN